MSSQSDYKLDLTVDELNKFYDEVKYQGFSRSEILKQMKQSGLSSRVLIQVAIACAIRGPQKISEFRFDGKSLGQLGIKTTLKAGEKGLSASRICAVIPHVVVDALRMLKIEKRIECDCPAEYQFVAASGIKMDRTLRAQHKEFSRKFSELIGGKFDESIYNIAAKNEFDK